MDWRTPFSCARQWPVSTMAVRAEAAPGCLHTCLPEPPRERRWKACVGWAVKTRSTLCSVRALYSSSGVLPDCFSIVNASSNCSPLRCCMIEQRSTKTDKQRCKTPPISCGLQVAGTESTAGVRTMRDDTTFSLRLCR